MLNDVKKLTEKYGADERTLLRENPSLENLYAFSNQREGIIEWLPFRPGERVLLTEADNGALCGILLRKGCAVDVLVRDREEASVLRVRCPQAEPVDRVTGYYDTIISIGTTGAAEYAVHADRLIAAVDNRYGIKYLAGTMPRGESRSREELQKMFPKAQFYYPMQDYLLPTVIYSDAYLPKQGELLHYLPAYRDNEFTNMDIGARYEEVVRDGKFAEFANSFLVISDRKSGAARRAIYVKYNRTRKDEYKIKTVIYENADGSRLVEKAALYEAGRKHIASLVDKYELLLSENRELDYARPVLSGDGGSVTYEYIQGKTLSEYIADNVARGADVYAELRSALSRIIENGPAHNIDSIFSNYLFGGRSLGGKFKLTGIDCEWVAAEEPDNRFLVYRALDEFYHSNQPLFGTVGRKEVLHRFGIEEEDEIRFRKLEQEFQENIHGDIQAIYFDNYRKQIKTAEEIRHCAKEAEDIEGLKAQLNSRDSQIRKMTEVKRLTDNHVANLEVMIGDLKKEIDNMADSLTYLNKHEALWSKVKRRAGRKFRELYPEGSDQYRKLTYRKMALLHPVKYYRMKHTEEGQNRMEGHFRIGEDYLRIGHLHFNRTTEPEVSIIIPCYNQVEYTYRCLASIREHTAGITFEIIIADDQSTDATAELKKFVSGIQIARTESNMGFLKNCNNAAKHVHGKYIMFLNNDTTVTDGWLTSLVDLMKRDASIGMTGSKLVFPDGKLQEAGGIIWSDGSGWNYGRGGDPADYPYNYVRDVDYISGAAILIRTELWKSIGGFDERYAPAYCEDSDLAFEVRKAGFRVVYQPLSTVVHYEGVSNGTDVNGSGLKHYQIENSEKLRQKWAAEFAEQFENNGNPDPFRARERSKGKKIILFVDHYVPTYDRDAGSKTTFQYIRLLLAKGYVVKFLPGNFLHDEPYTTTLEQMGVEILYGARMQVEIWDWIEKHARDLHLVYLNRPHIASQYVDYLRERTSLKIIYYGHDLHFLREQREFELTGDVKHYESSRYWKSVELGLMRKTDVNYYPSETEVEAIRALDSEIRVKAITAFVYDSFPENAGEDYAEKEGILFVGGFAHPPNKDGLLWFAKNIWPEVHARTGAVFTVVGSNADEEILALDSEENGICIRGFVTEEELAGLYAKTRVVAVPLRFGAGVKGKVIEALYYHCPVMTTAIGAEGIPEADKVMLIEDSETGWIEKLSTLYQDVKKLNKMSGAASEYIRENNSCEAAWEIIKGDFI